MYAKARDYDLNLLGERIRSIPGAEPRIVPQMELHRHTENGFIPVCEPDVRGNEANYAFEAVSSGWISSKGKFVQRFEQEFAECVGAKYGCAVNSGTSALHLTLAALGVASGDEVIMPAFTMIATPNAAAYLGATPILVDCNEQHYGMQPGVMEEAITDRTEAIVPVHLYGHPVRIDIIEQFAKSRSVPIIYDAAEAHGALYRGMKLGQYGLASTYSFFGNKIITTGEGGMVVSNDSEFLDICRNLRDMSFSKARHFWHRRLGYNFRMTNMQAAIGCAQVERFSELVRARIENRKHYEELLGDVPGLKFQREESWATSSHWMVGIEICEQTFGMTRDVFRERLAKRGVETRTYFVPIHLQPYYYQDYDDKTYPVSEKLAAEGLYLPSASTLTPKLREYVSVMIKEIRDG